MGKMLFNQYKLKINFFKELRPNIYLFNKLRQLLLSLSFILDLIMHPETVTFLILLPT